MLKRLGISTPVLADDLTELPCSGCGRPTKAIPLSGGYDVPICVDCRRQLYLDAIIDISGLKRRHREMTFESLDRIDDLTVSQSRAVKTLKSYDINNPRNIYIHSTYSERYTGTGSLKSHLACALCNKLLRQFYPVYFRTAAKILDEIRNTYSKESRRSTLALINDFATVAFLVIDDIGAERIYEYGHGIEAKRHVNEWVRETLYKIIDARDSNMLPTIVTSNYPPDQLAARIDGRGEPDRIVSRLIHGAIVIRIEGPDGRLKTTEFEDHG